MTNPAPTPSLPRLLVWHLAALTLIVLGASIGHGAPPWEPRTQQGIWWMVTQRFMLAYLVSMAWPTWSLLRNGRARMLIAYPLTIAIFVAVHYYYHDVVNLDYRYAAGIYPLLFTLILLPFLCRNRVSGVPLIIVLIVAAAGWGACVTPVGKPLLFRNAGQVTAVNFITTAFYNVQATDYIRQLPDHSARGGAISPLGERYLLTNADGEFFILDIENSTEQLIYQPIELRAPVNTSAFRKDTSSDSRGFRVTDMLTDTQNGAIRIFVSHNRWKPEEACYVLRVSTLTTTIEALESGADSDWETLYESHPCRPAEPDFHGLESGGRMALIDAHTLLLNDGYSGFWREQTAQNLDQSNGKSWLIDIETGKTELFSYGHRNHQGLHIDRANNIWATEHGPQGGDELNLLKRGSNYGWPFVSFGTQYGSFEWEMSEQQNKHEGYEQPVYAWVPSIGVSNLIRLGGEQFPAWEGNLLVTSLQDGTIYRLVIVENRVVVAEPMLLGPRLRDLLEMPDGRILLWTDEASIMVLANADTSDSDAALFAAMCSSCHAIDDTRRSGPNLETAYGRDIGDLRAYEYSNALDNRSGKWNRETLDAFLSNPQGFVPGTAMVIEPVTDPKIRKRLIDYLEYL